MFTMIHMKLRMLSISFQPYIASYNYSGAICKYGFLKSKIMYCSSHHKNLMELTQSGSTLLLLRSSSPFSTIPFSIALWISVKSFCPVRHCKRTSILYVKSSCTTHRERQTLTGSLYIAAIVMPIMTKINRTKGILNKTPCKTHVQLQ